MKIELASGSATPCLCLLDNRDGDIKVNKKISESANLHRASFETAKQYSLAWINLANSSYIHILNIHPVVVPLCWKKGPIKLTNKPCFQGVQCITTTIFPGGSLCHKRYILTIWWKSNHLFVHNIANRHTDTLDGRPWNNLVRRETVNLFIYCVVPDISCTFNENLFVRFSIIVPTVTDSQNRKKSTLN